MTLARLLALASIIIPVAAQAQPADTSRIVESLCAGATAPFPAITRQELAEAVAFQAGVLPSRLVGPSGDGLANALHAIDIQSGRGISSTLPDDVRLQLQFSISVFEQQLAAGNEPGFEVVGNLPAGENWLFAADASSWVLRCKEAVPRASIADSYGLKEKQLISIRQKPEELAAGGDARTKAGAFSFGLSRAWKTKDDGSETTDTTLMVDGTLGVRLTPARSAQTAYAFGQYNLKRVRSDPPAPLQPGERRDANDTNVLALGAMVDIFSEVDGTAFWLVGQTAFVRDFADRSSRVRFNVTLDPGFSVDLGICRLGSERQFGNGSLGARCLVRADIEGGLWSDQGLSTTRSYDDYVAVGGYAAYELYFHSGARSEVLAKASYRYLPMIVGDLADIDRLELNLKQRFWTERRLGIDVGAAYVDGTNALSLQDERSLSLGLGLIF